MKICFIQFSNLFFEKEIDNISSYYNNIYDMKDADGYYRNQHFYEIPLWIAKIDGLIKSNDASIETTIHYVTDYIDTLKFIDSSTYDYYLFSVMGVNKVHIANLIFDTDVNKPSEFIVGGYSQLPSIADGLYTWVNYIEGVCDILDLKYYDTISYRLFKGEKIIPRLELSTGCSYNCSFCTIGGSKVTEISEELIVDELVEIIENLDFKLIYIDDKTFGQAKNYQELKKYYNIVKSANIGFKGFIVQTSTHHLSNKNFVKTLKDIGVVIAEVGLETLNTDTLKYLDKTNKVENYQMIIDNCVEVGLKVIPNFMIGLPLETKESYSDTINFIKKNSDNIYIMNIYNLAIYSDTKLAKKLIVTTPEDTNELITRKSFHTDEENNEAETFSTEIFKLGNKILEKK